VYLAWQHQMLVVNLQHLAHVASAIGYVLRIVVGIPGNVKPLVRFVHIHKASLSREGNDVVFFLQM
jgi:hypothetical protein